MNSVISGDYSGKSLIAGYYGVSIGAWNSVEVSAKTVKSYELLDETHQYKKSSISSVTRATFGYILLGPVGLLAGNGGKTKDKRTNYIAIYFKDGKQSLIECDDNMKRTLLKELFGCNNLEDNTPGSYTPMYPDADKPSRKPSNNYSSLKPAPGSWRCPKCGRDNHKTVSTCACGASKHSTVIYKEPVNISTPGKSISEVLPATEVSDLSAEEQYIIAKGRMKKATTESQFLAVISRFRAIEDYSDSKELIEECKARIEEFRNDSKYNLAISKMKENSVTSIAEAIVLFKELGQWNDSAALIDQCNIQLEEAKIESKYKDAMELEGRGSANNYRQAADLYKALGDYKDSKEKSEYCYAKAAQIAEAEKKKKEEREETERRRNEERVRMDMARRQRETRKKIIIGVIVAVVVIGAIVYFKDKLGANKGITTVESVTVTPAPSNSTQTTQNSSSKTEASTTLTIKGLGTKNDPYVFTNVNTMIETLISESKYMNKYVSISSKVLEQYEEPDENYTYYYLHGKSGGGSRGDKITICYIDSLGLDSKVGQVVTFIGKVTYASDVYIEISECSIVE